MAKKLDALYVVSARIDSTIESHIALALEALAGGCKLFQLRDKTGSDAELVRVGLVIRRLCTEKGAVLIVDDRVAVAKKIKADGVHLGQQDASVIEARRMLGRGKIVGKSTHALKQALAAAKEQPDYISVGPIYKTPTKSEYAPVGMKTLERVCGTFSEQKILIPIVAIGGITYSNMKAAFESGAACVAVVREVSEAPNIEEKVKGLAAKARLLALAHR